LFKLVPFGTGGDGRANRWTIEIPLVIANADIP